MPKLTEEEFKSALPAKLKKSVNPQLINNINNVLANPDTVDFLKDNILGYTSVLQEGRWTLIQYLAAVNYVSYKLLGSTNMDAYIKTFPAKYQRFLARGVKEKDIASYATAYNKSKLVNLIFEQTLVPTYILNAPVYQQAINVQAELMITAKSEKVRSDAANSILTHLRRPEPKQVELSIGVKKDKTLEELRKTTQQLVEQQKAALAAGTHSAKQIAESPLLIEAEFTDAD